MIETSAERRRLTSCTIACRSVSDSAVSVVPVENKAGGAAAKQAAWRQWLRQSPRSSRCGPTEAANRPTVQIGSLPRAIEAARPCPRGRSPCTTEPSGLGTSTTVRSRSGATEQETASARTPIPRINPRRKVAPPTARFTPDPPLSRNWVPRTPITPLGVLRSRRRAATWRSPGDIVEASRASRLLSFSLPSAGARTGIHPCQLRIRAKGHDGSTFRVFLQTAALPVCEDTAGEDRVPTGFWTTLSAGRTWPPNPGNGLHIADRRIRQERPPPSG